MKIGKIISIEYNKFRVKTFHSVRNSAVNIDGRVYYFGNIGSYLKVTNSLDEHILCEVISIVDHIENENKIYGEFNLDSSREIEIKPIGTLNKGNFNMGIGVFPSLYTDVEIVTFEDLSNIIKLKNDEKIGPIHMNIVLGESKSLISYNIKVNIDKLFNIHTAVLGNTGSGKSTTIAHILQDIYRKEGNAALGAKTIIFDANGEYPSAFGSEAKLEKGIDVVFYKPNIAEDEDSVYKPFYLPYYLMNINEWLSFLMAFEITQRPIWERVLQESYKLYKVFNSEEEGSITKFVNYIKWKVYKMLGDITFHTEGDTSKMTAAKGAINKVKSLCKYIKVTLLCDNQSIDLCDLEKFLNVCDTLSFIDFGTNNNSLSDALSQFTNDSPREIHFVRTTRENHPYYIFDYTDQSLVDSFIQIKEADALIVDNEKLELGEYFDYKFLKLATEIVLLEEEAKGNLHIREFVSIPIARLDFFLDSAECVFMRKEPIKDGEQAESHYNIESYLEEVMGISEQSDNKKKQLITIDLSEVGTDALGQMTSVLSRMVFDYRKRKKNGKRQENPIHLILDEAHRYIREEANYIMRDNIFEKIAREGRKYALYLIISSQRPSELSQTVLSQCGNYIVHRIQNNKDMLYIRDVLPYFSDDYITKIKQAVPGEALIFGNCVPMPLMVKVKEANPAPNSKNCEISNQWFMIKDKIDTETQAP